MSTPETFSLLWLLGAISVFLYGIRITRIGLQLTGGERLRTVIASLTKNRFLGLATGVFVTLLLQSSSATVNMLVSFAGAGLINLPQAMGVLLGADIGTSLVVLLLSVHKISEYSMIFLLAGVALDMSSRRKRTHHLSMILIGFGFIFLGLYWMTSYTLPLKNIPLFVEVFEFLVSRPFYTLLLAATITPFLSSAGTLGLAIAFSFSGLLTLEGALPFVLGANIGTCITPILSSFSGRIEGRRVAVAHLLFKVIGVIVCLPLLDRIIPVVIWASIALSHGDSTSGQIAIFHILFNLSVSILFLPFIRPGVWLVERMLAPNEEDLKKRLAPKYLDPRSLETPSLAFSNVKREALRVADLVRGMFADCLSCYERFDPDRVDEIEAKDDKVDFLDREIKLFLSSLSQEGLTGAQAKLYLALISITSALEEIGDIIVQNILDMSGKKIHRAREFSEEGWSEIQTFHAKVLETFDWSISALNSWDLELAQKIMRHVEHFHKTYEELRANHLARLQAGLKESFETSSIHLDTLSAFYRIGVLQENLVRPIFEKNGGE